MSEKSVFLITEVWMKPGAFEMLKKYRIIINDLMEKFKPEYIFHNHGFEWVIGDKNETYPSGIEIVKFENIVIARSAIEALSTPDIKKMEVEVFSKVRCYMSRYAPPVSVK